PPEVESDGGGDEDGEGERENGEGRAHTEDIEDGGADDSDDDRAHEVPAQVVERRAPPRDQGPHTHQEDQPEEEWNVDRIEERRAHADFDPAGRLGQERKHGAEEYG